jgi:hypothetical protein
MSISLSVVIDHCRIGFGSVSWRRKFPRLYAKAKSWSLTWLSAKSGHDSLSPIHGVLAFLDPLLGCSALVVEMNHVLSSCT